MEVQTISQASKNYGISPRMLRYYEQVGLISSMRRDNYAYRIYDEIAIKRIKSIAILRKLRISVKKIDMILTDPNALRIIEIFDQKISELDEEITALSTLKSILTHFVEELQQKVNIQLQSDVLGDISRLSIIDSISFFKNTFKEDISMDELNQATQSLAKSKEKYIRIIYLPPITMAEINFYGERVLPGEENYLSENQNKETQINEIMANHFTAGLNAVDKFIKDSNLAKIKPDFRLFGFANCSKMEEYGPMYGFGRWLTIPDDLEVPFPFVKKQIPGGMYGAYSRPLPMSEGESDEWEVLSHWVCNNDKYEYDGSRGEPTCNFGMLEEYLNYINIYKLSANDKQQQTDLLMPIKNK